MNRRLLVATALVLSPPLAGISAWAWGDDPSATGIPVVAQVPARTYYVGQAIELRIGAEAAGERPEVETPAIADTDISLIGTDLSPVAATGIGPLTTERNLFVTRFRLITHRAGTLRIPPVRARLGSRSGASQPLNIAVKGLPLTGRPAEFLGGVGPFTVEAESTASSLRVGQDLVYSIVVTGPAARGMRDAPVLSRLSRLPLGLQVESLPPIAANSPPARRFRYRIRPTRAGAASLPPVAVAAFDPQTGRYVTKVSSSVPIRVVDVPKFDPSTLTYLQPRSPEPTGLLEARPFRTAAGLSLVIVALLLTAVAARRLRRRWRTEPGRWIVERGRRLDPRQRSATVARQIGEILAEYLERRIGRPQGVLTPEEARIAVAAATQDAGLASRTSRLVDDCDRACYSDLASGTSSTALVEEARQVFREIGKKGSA